MGRYRSRSRSYSPRRSKRYDHPHDSRRDRRRSSPPPSGLLVRNLPLDSRPEELRVKFEKFGPLRDVYLPKHYYTGEPRGFGFVKFRHPEDAADAKDHLNNTVIGGREIRIVFAEENRKAPNEMRRVSHPSDRGSYRRRSPARSPRRRYRSPSHSPSPARGDQRDRRARDDRYSPHRSRSVLRSISPRDEREYQSDRKSPPCSRSISRSPPRDKNNFKPGHKSRSPSGDDQARDEELNRSPSARGKKQIISRSHKSPMKESHGERSPRRHQKNYKLGLRSPSPSGDGQSRNERYGEPSRSPSSKGKARILSRSHRSTSPRGSGQRSGDERSPSAREKVPSPMRSPSPRGYGRRSRDKRYGEPDTSPSSRGKVCSPARSRSVSCSPR